MNQNYHPNQENALQRFIRPHRAYIQKERRTGLKDSNGTEPNR
jgi:hypothetical protein